MKTEHIGFRKEFTIIVKVTLQWSFPRNPTLPAGYLLVAAHPPGLLLHTQ